MVRYRMLATQPGSADGVHIRKYEKGRIYSEAELGLTLVSCFRVLGVIERVDGGSADVENKAITSAPHKQAMEAAPANMSGRKREKRSD